MLKSGNPIFNLLLATYQSFWRGINVLKFNDELVVLDTTCILLFGAIMFINYRGPALFFI